MISTSSLPKGTATDPQEPPTSSTSAATLLIGLQIGSRALTFLANQLLLRYLSPELLGISTQLDVYSMSVLFFAREGLRVAIQRKSGEIQGGPQTQRKTLPKSHVDAETTAGKIQTVVNLAYISICLGFVFTVLLAWLYLKGIEGSAVQDTPYFGVALKMYGVAAMCELLSEPCFVVVQTRSMYKIRARTEAAATLMRCLATCASAAWAFQLNQDLGVLPFAVGQVVYALVLIILYYSSFQGVASQIGFSLMIRPIFSRNDSTYVLSYFSRPLLILGASIFVQSIVKHILTQGDTVLIAALATPAVQGTYALANNYGGLLARLIFQPIEESSQNFFGRLLSTVDGIPAKSLVLKAQQNLARLLKLYILLSIGIVSVGPAVVPLLLEIVAGPRWTTSGAGSVLATYCYYIPFLAVNGITESFVSSVATESEVYRQSVWMFAFSIGFACAAYVFLGVLHMGAQGLVWANVLNMAFRIIWSTAFIQRYLTHNGTSLRFSELLPSPLTISGSVISYSILTRLGHESESLLRSLTKAGSIVVLYVIIFVIGERRYLFDIFESFKDRTKQG